MMGDREYRFGNTQMLLSGAGDAVLKLGAYETHGKLLDDAKTIELADTAPREMIDDLARAGYRVTAEC